MARLFTRNRYSLIVREKRKGEISKILLLWEELGFPHATFRFTKIELSHARFRVSLQITCMSGHCWAYASKNYTT